MPELSEIVRRLEVEYGVPARDPVRPSPINELVMTILSQHTSDINTARAFASLQAAFPTWPAVIDADTLEVVDAIRSGGLANQKAPRIQAVLREILRERGNFDLRFLADMPIHDASAWLTRLPGVGPKTAACVLLFSLDLPVMPVDTHVHRLALRLGIAPAGTTADLAHTLVGNGLSAAQTYNAHMLLIQHGRAICKARTPRCSLCTLNDICPSAVAFNR